MHSRNECMFTRDGMFNIQHWAGENLLEFRECCVLSPKIVAIIDRTVQRRYLGTNDTKNAATSTN